MKKFITISICIVFFITLVSCNSNKVEPITEELFNEICKEAGLNVSEAEINNGQTSISALGVMGVYFHSFDNEQITESLYLSYIDDIPKSELIETKKGSNYQITFASSSSVYNIFYKVDNVHIMISAGADEEEIEMANQIIFSLRYKQ